jgi:hypothetical protein
MEPGYDAVNNPDRNGDDYDFAINPIGTENDHIYEPFLDVGLDGVANTWRTSPRWATTSSAPGPSRATRTGRR